MVIENRDAVVAGVRLVATYKKQTYSCEVQAEVDGKLAFIYDGKSYNSPSSAGTAVIGTACNGWRFWSIEGEALAPQGETKAKGTTARAKAPAKTAAPKRVSKAKKGVKVFYRIPSNKDTAEGETRYYCNACAAGFVAVDAAFGGMPVDACPNGHRNDDPELTTPAASEGAAD